MHSALVILLPLAIVGSTAPVPQRSSGNSLLGGLTGGAGLLNLSPNISPKINASPGCVGVGISVCNPINVKGNQNTGNSGSKSQGKSQGRPKSSGGGGGGGDGNSLINIAPNISPEVGVGGGCYGVGISACDPINVGGNQNTGS